MRDMLCHLSVCILFYTYLTNFLLGIIYTGDVDENSPKDSNSLL
jgi:hypothetical protein